MINNARLHINAILTQCQFAPLCFCGLRKGTLQESIPPAARYTNRLAMVLLKKVFHSLLVDLSRGGVYILRRFKCTMIITFWHVIKQLAQIRV